MDFFSEFNNLQKQIFKNVFSNTSKNSTSTQNKIFLDQQTVKPRQNLKSSNIQKNEQKFVKIDANFTNQPTLIINPNFLAPKWEEKFKISQNGVDLNSVGNFVPINESFSQNLPNFNLKIRKNGMKISKDVTKLQSSKNPTNLSKNEKLIKNFSKIPENFPKQSKKSPKIASNSPNSSSKAVNSQPKKKTPKTKKSLPLNTNFLTPETSSDSSNDGIKINSHKSQTKGRSNQKSAGSERKPTKNVYDTPRTSYSVPLNNNDKNLRRGRSKFSKSFTLVPETPQKALNEISQDEFMDYFKLERKC